MRTEGTSATDRASDSVPIKLRIQAVLFFIYRQAVRIGLMSIPPFNTFILAMYSFYKRHFEMRFIGNIHQLIEKNSSVIDVGASLGFFSFDIAASVSGDGKIFAIEPEMSNVRYLSERTKKLGLESKMQVTYAAAGEACGVKKLKVDPGHPGNHRLTAGEGVEVPAITLDHLMSMAGWPRVSLVKIDVQGAEALVIEGAKQVLDKLKPSLLIEVDDQMLRAFGASSAELLSRLADSGYEIFKADDAGFETPLSVKEAVDYSESTGYCDFVFMHRERRHASAERK